MGAIAPGTAYGRSRAGPVGGAAEEGEARPAVHTVQRRSLVNELYTLLRGARCRPAVHTVQRRSLVNELYTLLRGARCRPAVHTVQRRSLVNELYTLLRGARWRFRINASAGVDRWSRRGSSGRGG